MNLWNIYVQEYYCNQTFGSIIGRYGKDAEKTLGKLLENNMVHLLASDTHKRGFVYEEMSFILKELINILVRNNKKIDYYKSEMYNTR